MNTSRLTVARTRHRDTHAERDSAQAAYNEAVQADAQNPTTKSEARVASTLQRLTVLEGRCAHAERELAEAETKAAELARTAEISEIQAEAAASSVEAFVTEHAAELDELRAINARAAELRSGLYASAGAAGEKARALIARGKKVGVRLALPDLAAALDGQLLARDGAVFGLELARFGDHSERLRVIAEEVFPNQARLQTERERRILADQHARRAQAEFKQRSERGRPGIEAPFSVVR